MTTWSTTELVPAGTIGGPLGLAFSPDGDLYVADYYNRIWKVTIPGYTASVFAGSGATGHTDGTGTAATFTNPTTLAFDASGNLYVAEWNAFRKITPAGVVTTIPGIAGNYWVSPSGLAVDASDNVYFTDWDVTVRKVTPAGTVTTLATVSGAELSTIAYDTASGDLFVTNHVAHELLRVTPAGVVTTEATIDVVPDNANDQFAAFDRDGVLHIAFQEAEPGAVSFTISRILRYSPSTAAWLEPITVDLPYDPVYGQDLIYGLACSEAGDIVISSYLDGTPIRALVPAAVLRTVGGTFASPGGAHVHLKQQDGTWPAVQDIT